MGKLTGRVALITGGARGQGAAEARLFVAEGARVVIADVLTELGEKLAAELGESARFERLDVAKQADWTRALEGIRGREGRLDVLINNAGIFRGGLIERMPLDDFLAVVHVNQIGCFLGMKHALPLLRESGGGSIVNIASVAGTKGVAGASAYASSKWAIRGLTKTAALEFARANVRVNAICPGSVKTPMIAPEVFPDVDQEGFWSALPVPRAAEPEEVARLALFLASDDGAYCTGADFVIDGGETLGKPAEGIH